MGCNHEDKSDDCGCNGNALSERVRYYPRQLLTADDMQAEQNYFLEKQRHHNRMLHGRGVVCGLEVHRSVGKDATPTSITICPGYALSPCGNEIAVPKPYTLDLAACLSGQSDPCDGVLAVVDDKTPRSVYIAIRYAECPTRPTRTLPTGCGCDETACEYSRLRDGYEIKCLTELPESHQLSCPEGQTGAKTKLTTKKNLTAMMKGGFSGLEKANYTNAGASEETPVALANILRELLGTCPPCPKDDWVVLAAVDIDSKNAIVGIRNEIRRWVINLSMLLERIYCLLGNNK